MALEIERKFIVNKNDIPWDDQIENIHISQGYFKFFKSSRIRKSSVVVLENDVLKAVETNCEFTFKTKTKDTLVRKEYNIWIPYIVFCILFIL